MFQRPLWPKILFEKLFSFFRFVFPHSSIGPTFPKVQRILAHICQIKWNLISFDDGNDKETLNKHSYTEKKSEHLLVNDSCPVRPVWIKMIAILALPVYNFDDINNIPAKDIQFTINDQLFLDVLLIELRGTAISYSGHKNKLKNIREQELLSNIKKIEQNLNESKIEELENYKTELYSIRQENLKGSMIRS